MHKLTDTCSSLIALKSNLPDKPRISDSYVSDYHNIVSILESKLGIDLAEDRVPVDALSPTWSISGQKTGTKESIKKVWERGVLLSKIDALLLKFCAEDNNEVIGFKTR